METARIPAPIGGLNTVDGGSAMPPQDAILAWNVLPSEHGLRSRKGYREHVIGIVGASSQEVRTIIPFHGTRPYGASDRLFVAMDNGIWDVTDMTDVGRVADFAQVDLRSGYGVWHVCTTPGGRFLLYADESNGLFVYSETSGTWVAGANGVTQAWAVSTVYLVGDQVVAGGNVYICTASGTSDAATAPTGTGTGITDGTVTWDYVSASETGVIGASLADQQAGLAFDAATIAAVVVWKARVWLVEKGTTRAWYLEPTAVYGTATSFDFAPRFRAGGDLRSLYNWSYDGGGGLDTMLVGISSSGDVVIYQGTDPASASTFGLKGSWSVGAVPQGRRIATEYGGDLLVLSQLGVVPMSRLVVGKEMTDENLYASRKVSTLFATLADAGRELWGWAITLHPTDNALLVMCPVLEGSNPQMLAMSFGTSGWARWRDIPAICADTWEGELYLGIKDEGLGYGRVCRHAGFADNVPLDGLSASEILCSVLTAYRGLGNARFKRVHHLRPILIGGAQVGTLDAKALYDFELSEPSALASTGGSGWDYDTWDSAIWGGGSSVQSPVLGGVGLGRDVAVAVRWSCLQQTTLVGVDIGFEQGGIL